MDTSLLESLLKALEFSPENIELRFQIAKIYITNLNYKEAEKHLLFILDKAPKDNYKYLLAQCYFKQNKFNLTEVILEEIIERNNSIEYLELYCYCLIEQNNHPEALSIYQNILSINKSYKNQDFESLFKISTQNSNENFTDEDAISFLKKPTVNFQSEIGRAHV